MTRRSGNPATRLRGETIRAVLITTIKPPVAARANHAPPEVLAQARAALAAKATQ